MGQWMDQQHCLNSVSRQSEHHGWCAIVTVSNLTCGMWLSRTFQRNHPQNLYSEYVVVASTQLDCDTMLINAYNMCLWQRDTNVNEYTRDTILRKMLIQHLMKRIICVLIPIYCHTRWCKQSWCSSIHSTWQGQWNQESRVNRSCKLGTIHLSNNIT